MSQYEKVLARFKSLPTDFTYDELRFLLEHLGFKECKKGKISGSRVSFIREKDQRKYMIHKPHPGNVVKRVYLKQIYIDLVINGEV